MNKNSVKSRFLVSLGANLVRGVVTLLITIVLARFLGSDDYGRVAFVLATFQAIRQLTDPGVSSAFYTFLSQTARSTRFVGVYWVFLIAKYLLTVIIIMWMMPDGWVNYIWRGEPRDLLVFSMTAVMMQFDGWQCAAQMLESQRRTKRAQSIYVSFLVLQLVSIYILQATELLSVRNYMLMSTAVWVIATLVAVMGYRSEQVPDGDVLAEPIFRRYLAYCLPMVPLTFLNFLSDFLDRWFLQTWAGNHEQALFSISQQIAAAILLITASMIRVLWKEIAEALHENKGAHAMRLYSRSKRGLFFISACIMGIMGSWAQEIFSLTFGVTYSGAAPVLAVMVIAATYQTLGQIEGTLLLASGRTKTGLWFNFMMAPIGIALSYFLVTTGFALGEVPIAGAGLGAFGLAIKTLLIQVVAVNVLGYLLCRQLNWHFEWVYQLKMLVFMGALGFGTKGLLDFWGTHAIVSMTMGLILYIALITMVLLVFPKFFDLGFELPRRRRVVP